MADEFQYDVFLSHASADKPAVRELAQRLKGDGLRVWLDEWVIHPGDSIPLAIEQGDAGTIRGVWTNPEPSRSSSGIKDMARNDSRNLSWHD